MLIVMFEKLCSRPSLSFYERQIQCPEKEHAQSTVSQLGRSEIFPTYLLRIIAYAIQLNYWLQRQGSSKNPGIYQHDRYFPFMDMLNLIAFSLWKKKQYQKSNLISGAGNSQEFLSFLQETKELWEYGVFFWDINRTHMSLGEFESPTPWHLKFHLA